MQKRLRFDVKEQMVSLSGACFWFWSSFHSFLDSSGVPRSISRRYTRENFSKYQAMRNILGNLEAGGHVDVIDNLISNFYRLEGAVDRDNLDRDKAEELLQEFRDLVGDDPIEAEIRKKEAEAARAKYKEAVSSKVRSTKRLKDLNSQFLSLASGSEHTPQERGYALEELFFDLLHLSEIEHQRPYRTPQREQIDGHFKFGKFDYLVEVKWLSGLTKPKHLFVFDGKIRGKAQSTRGLFLAAEGFDDTAVNKFSGDYPRIVLMTGEDLALVLDGSVLFEDLLRAKVDALVRYGRIDLPAREVV